MSADSFSDFIRSTREALSAAGLERKELEGVVYWSGGGGTSDLDTFVLIHGVNDQAGTWSTVVPLLGSSHRLIVPDLAGHGESAPASGPIPMLMIIERLHAVIAHEAFGEVTLVGNSMGGWISILYVLAHPERVARLVLESGGGLALPLAVPLVARSREEAMAILHAVHGPAAEIPEWAIDALLQRAFDSPMLRVAEAGLSQHFVDSRLGQINAPTLLIWGKDDGVVPLSYAEALRSAIRNARLQVIEGAAHIPHRQQPERFVACLTAIS